MSVSLYLLSQLERKNTVLFIHVCLEIYMYIHIMINVCYFVLCLMTIQILDFKSIKSLTLSFDFLTYVPKEFIWYIFTSQLNWFNVSSLRTNVSVIYIISSDNSFFLFKENNNFDWLELMDKYKQIQKHVTDILITWKYDIHRFIYGSRRCLLL